MKRCNLIIFKLLLLGITLLFSSGLVAQSFSVEEEKYIDSLFKITYSNEEHDTTKVRAYIALSEILYIVNIDTIIPLCEQARTIAEKNLKNELHPKEKFCFSKCLGTAYNNIGYVYDERGDYEAALEYYDLSLKLHEDVNDKEGQATAFNNIGFLHRYQGEIDLALKYYLKSLQIRKEIGDKNMIANSLNNLAAIFNDQGNIEKALDYYHQSLKLYEEMGDKMGQALLLNNIGYSNFRVDDIDVAQSYYMKSLTIRKTLDDRKGMANSYTNIGTVYKHKGMLDSAKYYYLASLDLDKEIGYKQGIASSLINLGGLYLTTGDTALAEEVFQESLDLNEVLQEKNGIASCLQSLAGIKLDRGNISAAIKLASLSLKYSNELGFPKEIKEAAEILYLGHKYEKNWMQALEMHELYSRMKDSVWNDKNRKMTVKHQFKYSYGQKAAADSISQAKEMELKNAEIAFKDSEAESQKLLLAQSEKLKWYLYLIIALVVVFAIFMYNRFRTSQKQKEIIDGQRREVEQKKEQIETQHHQLEETHKEISDSIQYAQRLQEAILPPAASLSDNLGDGFVLFQPKDVVSGDFYWMQRVDNQVFFAVADCTGHGVPGAMVSVVCSNALNRAVKEFNCTHTNDILDKTRELVIETFARSGKSVKDGMDISICSLSINKNTGKIDLSKGLEFSGANNPVWIVRSKNKVENLNEKNCLHNDVAVLLEVKSDRQPIGASSHKYPFERKSIKLEQEDAIYLFSDGYADQFGGERGKKMKYKAFKKSLLSMFDLSMEAQKEQLISNFFDWKNSYEQIDDVCIVGVKL